MKFFDETAGCRVEIPDAPRRIVSLAPDITDSLFRLVPRRHIVGISLYCRRPYDRLQGLPRVGSYLKVVSKRLEATGADLILTTLGAQRETTLRLRREGYPVASIPVPTTLPGVLDNFLRIGMLTNRWEKAHAQSASLHQQLHRLHRALPSYRTYWEVDLGGPITAGQTSYVHHALRWMGLANIYGDHREGYFPPDDRDVMNARPDLILYEPRKDYDETQRQDLLQRLQKRWGGSIPILILPHDYLSHYGPALIDEVMPGLVARIQRLFRENDT